MSLTAKFKKRLLPVLLGGLMAAPGAQALGLWRAYTAALENDPQFRGAKAENEAGREYKAIGRSSLLPTVSASYSHYQVRADTTTHYPKFDDKTHPAYTSKSAVVQLRQPVFSLDSLARYRQGVAQSESSDAIFASRAQELMVRVTAAYVEVLFASDQLTLATASRDTLMEQKRLNERMLQKGEGTRTDMLETQAKLDLAEANLIETRDNLSNARAALAGMTGLDVEGVDGLGKEFKTRPLQPADFEGWRALAVAKNPDLQALQKNLEAAQQEIKKSKAGHAPRLDFVASYSKAESESLSTSNQDSTTRSLGFQLNIPIYSGGYVNAISKQAVANHSKVQAEIASQTERVSQELRKQYNQVLNGVNKVDALNKAVDSARLLVQATQQSIKGGVRINLDLLNARQQHFSAQRDLAQAKYSYLLALLRLRAAAGVLEQEDLRLVAAYFTGK